MKSQRNVGSARKKDLACSGHLTKKTSNHENNTNNKFDLNVNISENVINKARKFDSSM